MDENDVFQNPYFLVYKKLLMISCLWPYQKRWLKFFVQTFFFAAIHTMMIPQMIRTYQELQEEHKNIEVITENLGGFFYFQGVLSKIYMNIYAEDKLQYLYETIARDYKDIREPAQRAAMVKLWSFARLLSIIYTSNKKLFDVSIIQRKFIVAYMGTACIFFVFTPALLPTVMDVMIPLNESRTKMLCYYAEYFIDQQKYFYYLVFHTLVCVAITLLIISAVDSTFIAVTYHVLGLFNLIICRLKQLCKHINDGIYREDELHKFVIDTIKIHKKTIELSECFADIVRITYNQSFFVITGMVLLMLSIGTIDLVMNLKNPLTVIRIGFVFVGAIGYMFFTNWPGQRFIDSSEELLESVYCCNWYKLPLKTQFLIKFMMMRCAIPCQLTAGPLLQLNFANCGLVLRTSLSYFTAVASMN